MGHSPDAGDVIRPVGSDSIGTSWKRGLTETTESTLTTVDSQDGTRIGYWTSGQGPPLVLVHGMTADHTRWAPLLPYLEPKFTVHAVDRRGRGASGDGRDYALEREFEDVAAVVDHVAASSGSKVDVYGHSSGGSYSFGAATLTPNIGRLVLYEGWPSADPRPMVPASFIDPLDGMLAEGDPEGVVEALMRDVVHMSEDDLAAYRSLPAWPQRVAAAHTIPREMRTEPRTRLDPQVAAEIDVAVLMLVGEQSPDELQRELFRCDEEQSRLRQRSSRTELLCEAREVVGNDDEGRVKCRFNMRRPMSKANSRSRLQPMANCSRGGSTEKSGVMTSRLSLTCSAQTPSS